MKKLAVTSLAALTLSLVAASGAQAVQRLPIEVLPPPGPPVLHHNPASTVKRLPCLSCAYRPPVGRYPPGYTPPPGSTTDYKPPVERKPPSALPPPAPLPSDPPPAAVPGG